MPHKSIVNIMIPLQISLMISWSMPLFSISDGIIVNGNFIHTSQQVPEDLLSCQIMIQRVVTKIGEYLTSFDVDQGDVHDIIWRLTSWNFNLSTFSESCTQLVLGCDYDMLDFNPNQSDTWPKVVALFAINLSSILDVFYENVKFMFSHIRWWL